MIFGSTTQHGSGLSNGKYFLTSSSDPESGWDSFTGKYVISASGATHWHAAIEMAGLGKGSLWTTGMPDEANMYVTGYSHSRANGVDTITVTGRGLISGVDNDGIAKRTRTTYEGGIETVTVQPAATAFVKSTGTTWAYTGSSWEDTLQSGAPTAGMLTVSSPTGLSSSISVTRGNYTVGASAGGSIRFIGPRLTFTDTYIANNVRFTPDATGSGGFRQLGLGSQSSSLSATLIGGVEPAPPDLPYAQQYSTPAQYDSKLSAWGWVLVGRKAEPVAPGVDDFHLVTDTFTYYNDSEFG